MRRVWGFAPPAAAVLIFGLFGCTNEPGTTQPTPTPTPTAAVCPAGDWRSTQTAASGSVAGATVTLQGGSGVKLTVAAGGAVNADFTGMQPITFTAQVTGQQVTGEIIYQGPVSGTVNLTGTATTPSPGTATPTGAATATTSATPGAAGTSPATASPGTGGASGPWQPVGQVVWGDLALTIRVTAPLSATIVDNVKVSDVTGAQTTQVGNAVDLQPLLREGVYRCEGSNLIITPSSGAAPAVTWTFERAV